MNARAEKFLHITPIHYIGINLTEQKGLAMIALYVKC